MTGSFHTDHSSTDLNVLAYDGHANLPLEIKQHFFIPCFFHFPKYCCFSKTVKKSRFERTRKENAFCTIKEHKVVLSYMSVCEGDWWANLAFQ